MKVLTFFGKSDDYFLIFFLTLPSQNLLPNFFLINESYLRSGSNHLGRYERRGRDVHASVPERPRAVGGRQLRLRPPGSDPLARPRRG